MGEIPYFVMENMVFWNDRIPFKEIERNENWLLLYYLPCHHQNLIDKGNKPWVNSN